MLCLTKWRFNEAQLHITTLFKTNTMKTLLTKKEKEKIAKYCRDNPYKGIEMLSILCKTLQVMTPREYAKKNNIPERTIYSMIQDVDSSDIELLIIGNNKYIPGLCN